MTNIHELMEQKEVQRQKILQLRTALKAVDLFFKSKQGLDYDYWSQEEKDLHEKAKQALADTAGK